MTIAKDEIFGPLLCIFKAQNIEETIKIIKSSKYGNGAMIYTSSGKIAREMQYNLNCGNVGINIGLAAPIAFFPFSGMKDSFFGDLHGQYPDAINFFTEKKVVISRWW